MKKIKHIDITGKRFGRLTAQYIIEKRNRTMVWHCTCDCGGTNNVLIANLNKGNVRSCGCLAKELSSERSKTHGMSNSRLYRIHRGMNQRCFDKNNKDFANYGTRGIKVCNEWFGTSNFLAFYNWSLANGYSEDLTLDRIDVNGNYEPDNCRWITMKAQNNNRRNNNKITVDGTTKTISEWAQYTGLSKQVILERVMSGKEGLEIIKPLSPKAIKKSGVKGVVWKEKTQRWEVYIKKKYIGFAKDLESALILKKSKGSD